MLQHADYSTRCLAESVLDMVPRSLLGFKRDWLRQVRGPEGELVSGMYFADAIGSEIVFVTHKFALEQSPTYSTAYRELLRLLDNRYGSNNDADSKAIKAELSGDYQLPPEKVPAAPAPEPAPAILPVPTTAEILAAARVKLSESLRNQIPASAHSYLYGGAK